MNLRWPARRDNHYLPWYVIAWRVPFFLAFQVFVVLAAACVLCMMGPRAASDFYGNFRSF